MRVLVTGVGGFLGREVARHLTAVDGLDVYGHARREVNGVAQCARTVYFGELRDVLEIPDRFDAVVHCASSGPWRTPEEIYLDNVEATRVLVSAAIDWHATKFIFCSSVAVYGAPRDSVIIDKEAVTSPTSPYGWSKVHGEGHLRARPRSMPSISLRLPGVIGPGCHDRNFIPRVARALIEGRTVEVSNLDRPFNNVVHSRDVGNFVEHLLSPAVEFRGSDRIVLCAQDTIKVRDLVERLAKGLGCEPRIHEVDPTSGHYLLDCSYACSRWGYDPMEIGAMIDRYASEAIGEMEIDAA